MREKLIELIEQAEEQADKRCDFAENCDQCPADNQAINCLDWLKADCLISNGVTIQKWIPVADPPKDRGLYLVTVRHWLDGKPVTREAYWNSEDWLSPERKHELTPIVTHWMPEPEAAKEGTE